MSTWTVDIKFYESMTAKEVPYFFPQEMWHNKNIYGAIVPGVYSVDMTTTEELFEKFLDWAHKKSEVKVLGTIKIK